jgi:uncharacterized SAM-binding protein YcdF (DUF218 family)
MRSNEAKGREVRGCETVMPDSTSPQKLSNIARGEEFYHRMTSPPAERSPIARARPRRLRVAVAMLGLVVVAVAGGFVAFLSQLRDSEAVPDRKADGIVVLTGGASRVSDGMELLAAGYGKRLLISGVHPTSAASDISRTLPEGQTYFNCCVDLDRSAVNTRSNAAETRRWAHERGFKSLIVVTSNYHMPRAIVELSHAMPEIELIPYAVVSEKWREEPWYEGGMTLRLVLSEYVKYVAAKLRVDLADLGIELNFDWLEQPANSSAPRRPTTAQVN